MIIIVILIKYLSASARPRYAPNGPGWLCVGKNNNNGLLLRIFLLPELLDFEEEDDDCPEEDEGGFDNNLDEDPEVVGRGEPRPFAALLVASCKNASSASATVTNSLQRESADGPHARSAPSWFSPSDCVEFVVWFFTSDPLSLFGRDALLV